MNSNLPIGRGGRGAAIRMLLQQASQGGLVGSLQENNIPKNNQQNINNNAVNENNNNVEVKQKPKSLVESLYNGNIENTNNYVSKKQDTKPKSLIDSLRMLSTSNGSDKVARQDIVSSNVTVKFDIEKSTSGKDSGISTQQKRSDSNAETDSSIVEGEGPNVNIGKAGRQFEIGANYFCITTKSNYFYMYSTKFNPQIDNKMLRVRLMAQHKDLIGDTLAGFNGFNLYLPVMLDKKVYEVSSTRRDGTKINIIIKYTKKIPTHHHDALTIFNVILRRMMRILKLVNIQRNNFDPKLKAAVPQHGLEIWPGFVTAIKKREGGLMLMMDVAHKVLRKGTVYAELCRIQQTNPRNFKAEAQKSLLGQTVMTHYNNKTYRIDDILFDQTPMDTFETHSGGNITYVEYYKTHYNQIIGDKHQPLLLNLPKKRDKNAKPGIGVKGGDRLIALIPELCNMTGLTDKMRADYQVMKDLHAHTRVDPTQRIVTMEEFIQRIYNEPQCVAELDKFGLAIKKKTILGQGRVLPPEDIIFANSITVPGNENAEFSRAVSSNPIITPVNIHNWLLHLPQRLRSSGIELNDAIQSCARSFGIEINQPIVHMLPDDNVNTVVQYLKTNICNETQIVVQIFSTSRDDRYNAFKKICCMERPVPSQVVLDKTLRNKRRLRSVAQKILLQMEAKMGAELWAVKIPTKDTMVIGMDVYHDGARGKGKSVLGFVSSLNCMFTRYYSQTKIQAPGEELGNCLSILLTKALKKYREINGILPPRIIIYRDGVGDGQLRTVQTYETEQFRAIFATFPQYAPEFAIIVVSKRIDTRLFAFDRNRCHRNPLPGSIMDHTITDYDFYDFFLVSQYVTQGTVSPTHYIVATNELSQKWGPDHIQRLTYKLAHLYYNWPGTIRVPAPCQYAHKVAYLHGQCLRDTADERLKDRLYYL